MKKTDVFNTGATHWSPKTQGYYRKSIRSDGTLRVELYNFVGENWITVDQCYHYELLQTLVKLDTGELLQ